MSGYKYADAYVDPNTLELGKKETNGKLVPPEYAY